VGEGEGIFNIIVLVDNRWSRFGTTESRDRSDLDCRDSLLIFIFATIRNLNWRTDVDDSRRLLGDTGARDEAIDNSLNLCSSCSTKVHFDIPVHIIEVVVPFGCLGDTVYWVIFRKVEVGIGPFLTSLDRRGDGDHVWK